jgi:O-antigen/teichoic acid export membrane protein
LDALFPELSRMGGRERGRIRLRALYFRARSMIWFAVATLALPCLLAAPHVLSFLYGETTRDVSSATLLRVLMLAFPLTFLYLLDGHALYAVGRQRRVTVAMILVTAFRGALNALTIPAWSYWGAVGAAFASEVLLYALLHLAARRFVLCSDETELAR